MIYKLKENRVYRTYFGGKHIDAFLGKETAEDSHFPEDWTASLVKAFNPGREDITEGYGKTEDGREIREICERKARCLVKLLDAAERLVIQVHPTRALAKEFFNSEYGKTECWYFLSCDKDAHVYIGFKEGVTPEGWRDVFDRQDIPAMLNMLHKIPVKEGDCIFVEGGVPHAIGAGCFMIEVQEPSDLMGITERQTPSGLPLPEIKLHGGIGVDKMMQLFIYEGQTEDAVKKKYSLTGKEISKGVKAIVDDSRTDKFSLTELTNGACASVGGLSGVAIVTEGEGMLCSLAVKKGDRLYFENEEALTLSGDCKVVVCY